MEEIIVSCIRDEWPPVDQDQAFSHPQRSSSTYTSYAGSSYGWTLYKTIRVMFRWWRSHGVIESQLEQKNPYFFNASTAFLATSLPTHNVSTRASLTSASSPTRPMFGRAVSPGRNCPVPIVVQQYSV